MRLFPGHILISNKTEDLYTLLSFKNEKTANVKNMVTGLTEKLSLDYIIDNYTLLKPAGYIGINEVELNNNMRDVIITLYKEGDLQKTPAIPYAVCRQCIIDFLYQQIDPKTEYTGISISQDTCPSNVDFGIMLSCNKVHPGSIVAVYLDYTLDYILSFVKLKQYDTIQFNNLLDFAKAQSDKYGNFVYKNIINSDYYMGYCKDIKTLLETNNFMHDFYRAFNIYHLDFDNLDEREGKSLTLEEVETISTLLCRNIQSTIIVKYGYDIDMKNISQDMVLISNKEGKLYVIGYIEDKTRPYEVPVEAVETEENIVKLNDVMTKAGKIDNNIRRAYNHVIFNKSKYE